MCKVWRESKKKAWGPHLYISENVKKKYVNTRKEEKALIFRHTQTYDSKSLTLNNCVFINNNDKDGAVSGTTPTTMRGCIFYHNNIDSKMKSLSLYSCKTSSSSFGTFISKDSNCETNFDKEPDIGLLKMKNACALRECSHPPSRVGFAAIMISSFLSLFR